MLAQCSRTASSIASSAMPAPIAVNRVHAEGGGPRPGGRGGRNLAGWSGPWLGQCYQESRLICIPPLAAFRRAIRRKQFAPVDGLKMPARTSIVLIWTTVSQIYDIAVIGGGPAGLTAAIALAATGASTALLARRVPYADNRTTALLGASTDLLERLEVWSALLRTRPPRCGPCASSTTPAG